MVKNNTFHIRVREVKIGYYTVQAETLSQAESKALYNLRGETEGEVCPAVDFEEVMGPEGENQHEL